LLVTGLLSAALSVPIADALAGGRHTVRTALIVVFALMPVWLIAMLLASSLAAAERWRAVVATTVTPFAVMFVSFVVLYIVGDLTVATASAATIAGALLALVPSIPMLIRSGRPRFRRSLASSGISFGLRSWVGGLALIANSRLDQVLMITLVAPRVLGLYAVAATLAGASTVVTGAIAPPLMTRVAGGASRMIPQVVRISLVATAAMNVALAMITPMLISILFGAEFRDAVPMALILLAAAVPLAGASVLSSALQADGAPSIPSMGEAIALTITIAGLATLLVPFGGIGAAIVSFAAYSASFVFQLVMAGRRIDAPLSEFLVPTGDDLRWARSRLTGGSQRLRATS
jgi:O-antigen/teichoic acid export membrane protein